MKRYSTSRVDSLLFVQHGDVEMTVLDSGIIYYSAIGPFNLETIQAVSILHQNGLFNDLREIRSDWSEVVSFHNSCLFTRDALTELNQYIQFNKLHQIPLKGVAFVIPEHMQGADITIKDIEPMYRNNGYPFMRFYEDSKAMAWAQRQLLTPKNSNPENGNKKVKSF